jgi:hypothetical protein
LTLDTEMAAKADLIRQSLVAEQAKPTQVVAAIEFAQAQLDLLRIRAVRGQMMAELDSASGELTRLRRLVALDRYEGRALARRYDASLWFEYENSKLRKTNPISYRKIKGLGIRRTHSQGPPASSSSRRTVATPFQGARLVRAKAEAVRTRGVFAKRTQSCELVRLARDQSSKHQRHEDAENLTTNRTSFFSSQKV